MLYLAANDGTDMRIKKELCTLSKAFKIDYIGLCNSHPDQSFIKEFCSDVNLLYGSRRNPISYLRFMVSVLLARSRRQYSVIYVVDEQLLMLIFPSLLYSRVVLDIFDSIFLKLNRPNDRAYVFKRLLYYIPRLIIVTDTDRQSLLPCFSRAKSFVLPNYPRFKTYPRRLRKTEHSTKLCIGLFGTLTAKRGVEFCIKLLDGGDFFRIVAGGWVGDSVAAEFINDPRINYIGIHSQEHVNGYIAENVDFVVMIYPPTNLNNIYASPNKLYDAIQCGVPVIVNSEIRVSRFVRDNSLGLVIDKMPNDLTDVDMLRRQLIKYSSKIKSVDWLILAREFCWESYEVEYVNMIFSTCGSTVESSNIHL